MLHVDINHVNILIMSHVNINKTHANILYILHVGAHFLLRYFQF